MVALFDTSPYLPHVAASAAALLLAELPDEALVALVLRDERADDAFAELVRRYQEPFLRVARGLVREDAEAQDVVQTAFLNIFHKLETFREGSNFKSWAYRVVTNCGLMRLRRRRVRKESDLQSVHPGWLSDEKIFSLDVAPSWSQRPDRARERSELRAILDGAVGALPEIYHDVFVLREYQDLSLQEISERLDLSVPAIKSRLHRARHHLRVSLEPILRREAEPEALRD